ncbi:MAG: polyprenyl synthetase family protein [Nitrospirota bacterium]
MDIKDYLSSKKEIIERFLESYLPHEESYPQEIHKAMRYSLFAGGKRLRPILSIASYETVRDDTNSILPVVCAIELIHTYSLIHDDLPSMDNDNFRRGKQTNHKVFGESIAILAGDALLTMAFTMMTDEFYTRKIKPESLIQVIREISLAAGDKGMVGGQAVDILSEDRSIDLKTLEYIHTNKTGALIRASVRAGGILAGANEEKLKGMTLYGEGIGLAFQITDDILDIEGTKEDLGKETGMDSAKGKNTYPALVGIDSSKVKVKELIDNALVALKNFDERADPLREIALYIGSRRN